MTPNAKLMQKSGAGTVPLDCVVMHQYTGLIMTIELLNIDCMEYMRGLPDKAFDLAIVDPPYGIGIAKNPVRQAHEKKQWDNAIPEKAYFDELKRVSKNQIIWGGNYFLDFLGNTQGFLIWDKKQPHDFSLAKCLTGGLKNLIQEKMTW